MTFTIGGNDLGFAQILNFCATFVAPGLDCKTRDMHDAYPDLYPVGTRPFEYFAQQQAVVQARVEAVIGEVRTAAPGATVVVMGYPELFGFSDGPADVGNCPLTAIAFSDIFAAAVTGSAQLDATLRATAARAGAFYVPVSGIFAAHGVCDRVKWIIGAENQVIGGLLSRKADGPYHPNGRGQFAYSFLLTSFLRGKYQEGAVATRTGLPANPTPTAPGAANLALLEVDAQRAAAPAVTSYGYATYSVAGVPAGGCPAARTGDAVTIRGADWAPGSTVGAAVNDVQVATVTAGPDGTAEATVTMPTTTEGLYRVNLRGTGPAGNTVVRFVLLQPVTTLPTCDATPPTIAITSPTQSATYTVGEYVNTTFTCTDPAIRTCEGTTLNGQAADTTQAGTYTIDVFADDDSGNATEASVTYTVLPVSQLTVLPDPAAAGLMAALAGVITTDSDGDLATPEIPALLIPTTTGPTTNINGCTVPTPATPDDALLLLAGQPYQARTGPAPAAAPECRPAAVTTTTRP